MKSMKTFVKHHLPLLLLDVVFCILIAGTNVILAFAMGNLSNAAVEKDRGYLLQQGAWCVGSLLFLLAFQIMEVLCRKTFAKKCVQEIKRDAYHKILKINSGRFHEKGDTYYLNLLCKDVEILHRDYFSAIGLIVSALIKIGFSVLALAYVSYKIFIVFIVVSCIPPCIIRRFKGKIIKITERYSEENKNYFGFLEEFVQGYDTIMRSNRRKIFFDTMIDKDRNLERARFKRDVSDSSIGYVSQGLSMVAHIICMIAATYFILTDDLEIGVLITSTQLLNFVFTPFGAMMARISTMKGTQNMQDKILDLLNEEEEPGEKEFQNGDIRFEGVTISFGEKKVIQNFFYRFEMGKKYAIIGKTGIGKSSLVRTLLKETAPEEGHIFIGETDIEDIKRESLTEKVFYAGQAPYIFKGSISDNITLFDSGISREKLLEVCEQASIDENLLWEQKGSDLKTKLSGGEKTRIELARALLAEPDIYIFDEPTSALDPDTAGWIDEMIAAIKDKTVLVVTHNWEPDYLEKFDGVVRIE